MTGDLRLGSAELLHGDCRDRLRDLPDNSVDSVVTDPPYELGFMGKAWDASGIAYSVEFWRDVLRVLKPGGHMLAFGATRTYHRMVCAVEDAGFEIRDQIDWMYGTGMPKSLTENTGMPSGQGTALKPGHEPIVLARKPPDGTIKQTIAKWGTGGLNIDACRSETRDRQNYGLKNATRTQSVVYGAPSSSADFDASKGRWPANVLLDEGAAAELDAQTDSTVGVSRFFYVAKAGRAERDLGCETLPVRTGGQATGRKDGTAGVQNPRAGAGRTGGARNFHPTVKPVELLRHLVRLVTPTGGLVLDPFAGSGSTAVAALAESRRFIGIEQAEEYARIAEARIRHSLQLTATGGQLTVAN